MPFEDISESPITDGHDSFGDKLAREWALLSSVPDRIAGSIINKGQMILTDHKNTDLKLASSLVAAAGLTLLSRNGGAMGAIARSMPKVFGGLTAADMGYRVGGPVIDTWQHPENLYQNQHWLSDNLGSAVVDYSLVALGGMVGSATARTLRVPFTGIHTPQVPRLRELPGKALGGYKFNAPVVMSAEYLNRGSHPDFPKELPVPPIDIYTPLPPNQPENVIEPGGLKLTEEKPTASFGVELERKCPVRLDLSMSGPGTDWGRSNAESAVLSVYIDGKYSQDAVLFGGSDTEKYSLNLHDIPQGKHTITLRYAHEKSSEDAGSVAIASGTAAAYSFASDDQRLANRYAPILYGRHGTDNNHTDVPMSLVYDVNSQDDGSRTITYYYVYSNEDAGSTNPPANGMARLGRLTDIDPDYKVTVNKEGRSMYEQYSGAGHNWLPFHGRHEGTHPVLRVQTKNNMVVDYGTSPLKFHYVPELALPEDAPKEELMRQNPLWFETMGKEIIREGTVASDGISDAGTKTGWQRARYFIEQAVVGEQAQMADARDYLYVQMNLDGATPSSPMGVRAYLKDGTTADSDWGAEMLGIDDDGWSQTAIALPPNTMPADIVKLQFIPRGEEQAKAVGVRHIYMLDDQFRPQDVEVPEIIR